MRQLNRVLRGVIAGLIFGCAILVGLITADPALGPGMRAIIWVVWVVAAIGAWIIVEE